jgi:hypothetical protein
VPIEQIVKSNRQHLDVTTVGADNVPAFAKSQQKIIPGLKQ